jgi:hypothetical protein
MTIKYPDNRYQLNTSSAEDIQQAIDDVPIKDYSDYDISVETTTNFEDALFKDQDQLSDALESPDENKTNTHGSTISAKTLEQDSSNPDNLDYKNTKIPSDNNFKAFLTPLPILSNSDEIKQKKTNIINSRLNDSPTRKIIELGIKANLFDQVIINVEQRLIDEALAKSEGKQLERLKTK